jgi:lipid-A-disaccharide synthase
MNGSVLIIAGENSGEKYGAALMREFRRSSPQIRFFGIGGSHMQTEGAECLFTISDLSMVGIFEVFAHLKKIGRIYAVIRNEVRRRRPQAAVLIDSPDFNLRLAARLKKLGVPVLYYISPTVWAWRSSRLKSIKKHVNRMLLIFPFEKKIYDEQNIPAVFVGHPLIERVRPTLSRTEFFLKYGLDPDKQLISLLPGSRENEIRFHMPHLGPALESLARKFDAQFILIRADNISASTLRNLLPAGWRDIPFICKDIYAALASSQLALSSCGTANLEAALLETPVVAFYRVHPLSFALGIRFLKIPRFSIVNILADKPVIPELIQKDFTADAVVREAGKILSSDEVRDSMREEFRRIRAVLGREKASVNAAAELKRLLEKPGSSQE